MGDQRVFELMIEIGHKSKPLSKKLPNGYTHKWTAYVRGHNNSKPEHCIQRVVFQLHDSFEKPHRDITSAPFQIHETGYAGFEIPIQIYFRNKDKPNHLVFVHDLCLLTNKPNNQFTTEKLKFINPNKDFEKRLIKSGAQLLPSLDKKERSDSPPAKKRKSSSLIPSKDMSQQQTPQTQTQSQPTNHQTPQQQHHKTQSHHNQTHGTNSNHQSRQPHPHQSSHKPKPSREFIDVFGPPLVYNSHKQNSKDEQRDEQQGSNELQSLQAKISCLSDTDRLQKIVDIIEEAGEWFNVTPKKFEFDLKRLDKKTLSKIERCLHH